MKIVARIEKLVQISPDDYRVKPLTMIFDSTASVDFILAWAKTHGEGYLVNDIELSQPEEEKTDWEYLHSER